MDGLLDEFIAETRETLAPLAGEIVAWEAAPGDRARLDAIFRFVHTVKGSCGFLELPRLERLSHAAESALADVREGRRPADAALVSAVLAIIDRIGAMVDALDRGEVYPEGGDEALVMAAESRGEPTAEPTLPTADPGLAPVRNAPRTVRLPVDLLDRMMGGVSDLVLARNALSRLLRDTAADPTACAAFDRLSVSIADLRDAVTRTRMQRIEQLFAGLPRMVRDLAHELGKPVALEVEGADVELDREMIEMIRNPLTHIMRNALDHGFEPAAARAAAGKPATGLLRVGARQAGNQILITVSDDGRGVDADRLAAKAVTAGIVSDVEAAAMTHADRLALMFAPGLSTAGAVTAISGRGVGMDIVRANVERIGGVVEVDSTPGRGTRLTLRVPLTLTIIPALTLTAGGLTFALPRAAIEEIVRIGPHAAQVETVGGTTAAMVRDQRLPLASLRALLGVEDKAPLLGVALRAPGGQVFLLGVDEVHDHEELVIRPAAPAVTAAGIYAGATLSDAGQPMLLLDPAGLAVAAGIRLDQAASARVERVPEPAAPAVPTLLFRDIDGAERGVRLAMVDRIEDVAAGAIRHTGGRLHLTRQGRLVPVAGIADPADGKASRVLMMSDGAAELAYPVDRVIDIVALSGEVVPAAAGGPVFGVTLHEGRQIELLDPFWLFAEASAAAAPSIAPDRPLCLIADDSHWARDMLRPLIEAAGYRVALPGDAADGDAVLVIATEHGSGPDAAARTAPLVRLRDGREPRDPADTSIWRYDRAALVAALGARAA